MAARPDCREIGCRIEDKYKEQKTGNSRAAREPVIVYSGSQAVFVCNTIVCKKIILYGSYARGDYHLNSDVDVMILVKMSEEEIKQIENMIYDMIFDIQMETGVDISPIIKNEDQYEYWVDVLPFYAMSEMRGLW